MRCVSLISLFLLAAPALAVETSLSGFAYYTWFQDKDWFDDESRVAVNGDITAGNFALRGQVSTQDNPLRRLVVEYARPVATDTFAKAQVGRFVRLDGFYNNVTDSPTSSGMSVLPMATYNRRMNTGTFTIMDGAQVCATSRMSGGGLVEYGVRYGSAFIDDDDDLQKEAFGQVVSDYLAINPHYNNYDAWTRYTKGDVITFISYNHYRTEIVANPAPTSMDNLIAQTIATKYHSVIYDTIKIGAEDKFGKWTLSSEYHNGRTHTEDVDGFTTRETRAHNAYVKLAYDLHDDWTVFALHNHGQQKVGDTWARDSVLGLTYDNGKWFGNIEYHRGRSNHGSWVSYDSPAGKTDYNAFVATAAVRF